MTDPIAFASTTPRMLLPLLFSAQAHKELFHNEALQRIDTLMHAAVERQTDDPPSAPQEGKCWIVGSAPSGDWTGHGGEIAIFQTGRWQFADPFPGLQVFNLETMQFVVFFADWQKAEVIEEPSGGLYVDSQARAAIGALISALRAAGIYPSA
jgi:hypothetical protein